MESSSQIAYPNEEQVSDSVVKEDASTPPTPEKLNLKTGVSSFSLSSIALKKAASKVQKPKDIEAEKPKDAFALDQLKTLWKEYIEQVKNQGKHNIASILSMNEIAIKEENTLLFSVANDMNKVEMNREMENLLPFLRERLNNFGIHIELNISETTKEDAVYSAQEKYQYLIKINPTLEELRNKFDLEIN